MEGDTSVMVTIPLGQTINMQLFGEFRNDLPDPLTIDPDMQTLEYEAYFGVNYPNARFIANVGCVHPTIIARIDTTTANYIGHAYCLTGSPVNSNVTPQTISGAVLGAVINMPPGQIAGNPPIGLYPVIFDLLDDDFLSGVGAYQAIFFGPNRAENYVVSTIGGAPAGETQGADTPIDPFYSYSDVYDNAGTAFVGAGNVIKMYDDNSSEGLFQWNLDGTYNYIESPIQQKYATIYEFAGETYFLGAFDLETALHYHTFSNPEIVEPIILEGFPDIGAARRYHTTPNIDYFYTVDPYGFNAGFASFFLIKKDLSSFDHLVVGPSPDLPPFLNDSYSINWSDDAGRFLVLGGDW